LAGYLFDQLIGPTTQVLTANIGKADIECCRIDRLAHLQQHIAQVLHHLAYELLRAGAISRNDEARQGRRRSLLRRRSRGSYSGSTGSGIQIARGQNKAEYMLDRASLLQRIRSYGYP